MSLDDITKIIHAAMISKKFQKGLLDPDTRMGTIGDGYEEEKFLIDPMEKQIFKSIGKTKDLPEFTGGLLTELKKAGVNPETMSFDSNEKKG